MHKRKLDKLAEHEMLNKKNKQEATTSNNSSNSKPTSPTNSANKIGTSIATKDLTTATLRLKFVNREKEAERIVNTLASNKHSSLSNSKLVSLFQTFGIGKTSLVRRFREVYEFKYGVWKEEYKWIRDLQLFELDFRYFPIVLYSGQTIESMSQKIADFVVWSYECQLIQKAIENTPPELLKQRRRFHQKLKNITNQEHYSASQIFQALNSDESLPEGYLVFIDEVDAILLNDFEGQLKDSKWNTCKIGCDDLYLSRFQELWSDVTHLITPIRSTVIFSGHIPVHLALQENNQIFKGSLPSDYCLVFLSSMTKEVIQILLEQSVVQKGECKISLLDAFKLLGLNDIEEFIDILVDYTVLEDNVIKIIIPKLMKDSILKNLAQFKAPISGIRYQLLQNNNNVLKAPKALELSVIDLLAEMLVISFTKTREVILFGDLCGGIFKDTFFSNLELPSNFETHNKLIPGFSPTSTTEKFDYQTMGFGKYLKTSYTSFISVLDDAMSGNQFCAAIPGGETNTGFDILITLNKTSSQLLRKLLLFDVELFEKNFTKDLLQKEIDQAVNFLPNTYSCDEKPSLQGDNLHFLLIMVVLGFSDELQRVIENNADNSGSLLITETCYLQDDGKLSYTKSRVGTESWLQLKKGGFQVLLLSKKGLQNLLSNELYSLFHNYCTKKKDLYREMICFQSGFFQNNSSPQTLEYSHTPFSDISSNIANIGSSQMHTVSQYSTSVLNIPALQRASGRIIIGNVVLDKLTPKCWKEDEIHVLLKECIGISENRLVIVEIYGSDFENIIDALISFNGDKEAKIKHALSQPLGVESVIIKNTIIRWVFNTLLEYTN
ncbi:predicted protein [Naegleria gruberi]|uniref:Predicted protein n=1 Tax=Naegleria gruberi TaxID=5762 RepID=D2VSB9_NAEGR|nr:uncharacterized protein NAEGRDRAFT_51871 [Naegleria gruberi]EFC40395.1 predicted protein [Naegleria gruberi]|eukprot:XP_002673139.1 predicted protein [Naegleria gruberi strain NEG-M]